MDEKLTVRQFEIMSFIQSNFKETGATPSVRAIANRFSINSPNGLTNHLKALVKKGFVRKSEDGMGSLVLTEAGMSELPGKTKPGLPLRNTAIVGEESRFWRFVDKGNSQVCWPWKGTRTQQGYGQFQYRGGVAAHRFSFELHNGPLEHPKIVCHRCDNPPCVNPNHLFAGTHSGNIQDMHSKGRSRWQKMAIIDFQI